MKVSLLQRILSGILILVLSFGPYSRVFAEGGCMEFGTPPNAVSYGYLGAHSHDTEIFLERDAEGEPVAITLHGSHSYDEDSSITQYKWYFDDGESYAETENDHPDGTFDGDTGHDFAVTSARVFNITLEVKDEEYTDTDPFPRIYVFPHFTQSYPRNVTEDSMDLAWSSDVTEEEWGAGGKFEIHQSTTAGFTPSENTRIATITTWTEEEDHEYTVENLSNSTLYYFKIRLFLNSGVYRTSNEVAATTGVDLATIFYYDDYGNLTGTSRYDAATGDYYESAFFFDTSTRRLTKAVYGNGESVAYAYDAGGNCITMTYPGQLGSVAYSFDNNNRLVTMVDPNSGTTSYGYDRVGNVTSMNYPNETYARYEYSSRYFLTKLENRKDVNTVISTFACEFDKVGNVTRVIENDNAQVDYVYDNDYQLLTEVRSNGSNNYTISYVYDDVGNRLTMVKDGTATAYEYDNMHRLTQLVSSGSTTTYTYDDTGNLVTKITGSDTTTYEWSLAGKLTKITLPDSDTVSYAYDGKGNRVQQVISNGSTTTTNYIVDYSVPLSRVLVEENAADAVQALYVYGNDLVSMEKNSSTYYYHYDRLGSVVNLTDSNKNVKNNYRYYAFGGILSSTEDVANVYRFTGEEHDADPGLVYLRARYYDPEIGRFISVDPTIEALMLVGWKTECIGCQDGRMSVTTRFLMHPQQLHPYVYCANNPVNRIDPTGLFGCATNCYLTYYARMTLLGTMVAACIAGCVSLTGPLAAICLLGCAALEADYVWNAMDNLNNCLAGCKEPCKK